MNTIFTLSFQLKISKINESGKAPIYARITINGIRSEFSTKRYVEPGKWISAAGAVKSSTEEGKSINHFLNTLKFKMNEHYRLLIEQNKTVTTETLKNAYLGITEKSKTIREVFDYHNQQMKSLVGKEFSLGTYTRYCTALKHTLSFIQWKYNLSDFPVKQVSHEFITEFEYYLKVIRKCGHNSALKYITNFKKIIRICLGNGWIEKNPFINYKIKLKDVQRDFLLEHELNSVMGQQFYCERLDLVRDVFIFCCFTGLSYSDVKKISRKNIVVGIDGNKWIKINRTKTDTMSSIPLLPVALLLLEKYEKHPKYIADNKLMPVLSNQKLNAYLKEIADLCKIDKNLTMHVARHSFATTVTLTNGVPLETVSKMLGHRNLKMTSHYARIIDKKVCDDMQLLKEKYATNMPVNTKTAS